MTTNNDNFAVDGPNATILEDYSSANEHSYKWLRWVAAVTIVLIVTSSIGGYLYWRSLSDTPQYRLALLIDAAKRGDTKTVDELVDVDAVVDDFVPQVLDKAAEIYGRGLPPAVIRQMAYIAQPILPAVKEKARAEVPRVIRERTAKYGDVPFVLMVIGADRYLNIEMAGDTANVSSTLTDREFTVRMRRTDAGWQVTGFKDDQLASDIAQRIGQEVVAIAVNGGVGRNADGLDQEGLIKLLRDAEEILP